MMVKSSHQSRCHVSPTQELIACILRRQSSPIYGVLERTEPERKARQIRALQIAQKTTPQEKSWVKDGSVKERETVTLRKEKGTLYKRKQSY